jgi:hypothetical protein
MCRSPVAGETESAIIAVNDVAAVLPRAVGFLVALTPSEETSHAARIRDK